MIVYDKASSKKITIDEKKELSRGGEGRIIEIGHGLVAKLYLQGIEPITDQKFNSLNAINAKEFIKPKALLISHQASKDIIGFIMDMVPSDFFPLHSAFNSNYCQRNNLTESWKLSVSQKLITCLNYIHSLNIVIGDFSGFNILAHKNGDIAFIDVDSYETPGNKHSGRLLHDIRDFYHNGEISKNADYFSLAVVIFNLITTVHPYKGIHQKYKDIQDRMIYKLSILKNDPNLKIPKCYEPITDQNLLNQFERIFNEGERFLLNLNPTTKIITKIKTHKPTSITKGELVMKEIFKGNIEYMACSNVFGCILEDANIHIYDLTYKGHAKPVYTLSKPSGFRGIFPTDKNVIIFIDKLLYKIDLNRKQNILIQGFQPTEIITHYQIDNTLIVITNDNRYQINLDGILNNYIQTTLIPTYGKGYSNLNGLIQRINGKNFIYYQSHDILNTVSFPLPLKDIYQKGNVGIAHFIEDDKERFSLFVINGLDAILSDDSYDNLRNFGYNKDNGYIILPEDDNLTFLRAKDFYPIAKYECDLVDEMSQVFNSNAGIVVNNGTQVFLINKK